MLSLLKKTLKVQSNVFIYLNFNTQSQRVKKIKNSLLKRCKNENIMIFSKAVRESYRFKTSWGDEN